MRKKFVTYIESLSELEELKKTINDQVHVEVIMGCSELSRFSKLSCEELIEISSKVSKNKIELFLEWDVLNQESKFKKSLEYLKKIPLENFSAIRVQDPGALEYIKNHYPWQKIHVILENGNHNLLAIKTWVDYLNQQCSRVVLSNELSIEKLKDISKSINVPIEIQVFGRILLFYSPRKLLSPLEKNQIERNYIEAFGTSEESPHSGFPLIENQHGTFMFNVKDLSLLDQLDELISENITHFRVDMRFDDVFKQNLHNIASCFAGTNLLEGKNNIKLNHCRPLIKGFFNVNKTDVLFTKLKNKRIQRSDNNYIGEVVDVEKEKQIAIIIKSDYVGNLLDRRIRLSAPDGKEKIVELKWVRDSLGNNKSTCSKHDIVLLPYLSGITVRSQVYFV